MRQELITRERVKFYISVFKVFHSFMMPYQLIPLISALEEFYFFVTVGSSTPFGPALDPPKIENSGGTWLIWFLGSLKSLKLFRKLWKHLRVDFSTKFPVYFTLISLQLDFMALFTRTNFFFFQNSHFNIICTRHIMTFYLVTWTYLNDVYVGRNILISSQLKKIFLWAATRKIEAKLRKTEKT